VRRKCSLLNVVEGRYAVRIFIGFRTILTEDSGGFIKHLQPNARYS
jgi:hypothetical protein